MPEMVFGFILFVLGGLSRGYVMSRLRESGTSVRLFGGRSKEIHYLKRYLELVRKNRDIYNGRYGLPGTALLTGTAQGQNLILLHELGHITGATLSDNTGNRVADSVFGAGNSEAVFAACSKTISGVR